ncbi:3033_t:CDS:2 [Funneliformis geosporum]|uniref:3033_t:CDS:1 n=1 Tax=Funneliformis geosporum TaxID=1117311 RepID=A0A9W4SJU8_9GLOM|nr:3033_t:CDS:2 [Funneliformis geosporum]
MFLDDTSSKALKKYLSHHLEPICDADPKVLADYVIALLKHDKPDQDLKQLCIDQLDDFLRGETRPFVEKLFDALGSQEYLGERVALTAIQSQQESTINASSSSTNNSIVEGKSTKSQELTSEKVDSQPSKMGVRKREDSEASDDDDDRNYKHRERGGENRDDYRRYTDRSASFSNREDDRDSKNKRFRSSEGIPTGPASGGSQYNNNFQDDRSFKRRRDEPEEEFRSNKIPRNNSLGTSQPISGSGNGYVSNNGMSGGNVRRAEFERDNRINRNFPSISSGSPGSSISSGRWGNEWVNNGMNSPVNDRFDDRRIRGGRLSERGGGRSGPMVVNRGSGYSDVRPGRRQRCRDYDEKGYCMRGDLCPFDHGVDRIVVDDVPLNRPFDIIPPMAGTPLTGPVGIMSAGVPSRPPYFMSTAGVRNQYDLDPGYSGQTSRSMTPTADAYDPERATLSRPEELISVIEPKENEASQTSPEAAVTESTLSLTAPSVPQFLDSSLGISTTRGTTFRGRGRSRGSRGGFNANNRYGSSANKNATLVVENIPKEFCTLDKVNEFFKKFAYNSPEPIFDYRFVKVYWYKEKEEPQTSTTTIPKPVSPVKPDHTIAQPEISPPANAAEKKEAEEKAKKQKESLKAMLEIQKQREQLINRQIEEQKKLMELAKKKNVNSKNREEVLKSLSKVSEDIKNDSNVPVRKTSLSGAIHPKSLLEEKEREQLDRELDILSKINENSAANEPSTSAVSSVVNAQSSTETNLETNTSAASLISFTDSAIYRGRGRAVFYRGRARGSWPRVRGGSAMRSYKLDNRTSKLLLKEVPAGSTDILRNYFQQFGELETFTVTEETRTAIVQFKNRKDAEQALVKGSNIPDVGQVQMTWHTETSSATRPAEVTTTVTTSSNTVDNIAEVVSDITESQIVDTESSSVSHNVTADFQAEDDEDEERERSWKR